MTAALVAVLVILIVVNVWVHVGPQRSHVVTGPLAALVLLAIGRAAGLSWGELGLTGQHLLRGIAYGAAAAGAIAVVYAAAMAVPFSRRAFLDTRYQVSMRRAALTSVVTIPLATVVFEEVAFRSVLWGLLDRDHGATVATFVSSVLFGLWHILPALHAARTSTAIRGAAPIATRRRALLTVLGTVLFTALAGVVFAELRRRSGSLAAPMALHWAANGIAVVAAARAWAVSPPPSSPPPPVQQPRR